MVMKENEYHNYDPKKPLPNTDDFRTSYYRGHREMRDPPPAGTYGKVPNSEFVYSRPPRPADIFQSEFKASYGIKTTDPNLIRNPKVSPVHGMKDVDGRKYKSAPKPLDEFRTRTHTDYDVKTQPTIEKPLFVRPTPYTLQPSKIRIDPSKPGFSKHLDMMATTNMLTYFGHDEKGLQQNDIITLWSWMGTHNKHLCAHINTTRPLTVGNFKEELCYKGASDICPRRRAEFPSIVKRVPHSGMTSETRDNFKKPESKTERDVEFTTMVRTVPVKSLVPYMGMNSVYGSGEPVDKFVSITNYDKLHK